MTPPPAAPIAPRRLLLGLTGLGIEGGIASVSRCIARALDEAIGAGTLERADRVLLLDDPAAPPAPPRRGVQWLARGSQPRFALQTWAAQWRARPELLFFDQLGPARSLQLPLPRRRIPYAVFCHGIELDRATPGSPHERALLGASLWLANSHHTGDVLRARHPQHADRLRVTPLCIDPLRTAAFERAARAPERSAAREPVVLIIGRMWAEEPGKGHDALLEAWPAVRRAVPDARLEVVGDGDDRPRLEQRARQLGLLREGSVRFLGRVPDTELARCYQRAALFAMPSQQEGFGLVYAEAMWHGLPCLGSTADAAREVIRDGETGVLVPYGDAAATASAIVRLLGDAPLRERLGRAAHAEARARFGYERFRDDLLQALGLPALASGRAGGDAPPARG